MPPVRRADLFALHRLVRRDALLYRGPAHGQPAAAGHRPARFAGAGGHFGACGRRAARRIPQVPPSERLRQPLCHGVEEGLRKAKSADAEEENAPAAEEDSAPAEEHTGDADGEGESNGDSD